MSRLADAQNKGIKMLDRFLKTDSSFLIEGSKWTLSARVVSSVFLFAVSFVFARYLPRDTFGTYKYILTILGVLDIFAFSGLYTAYVRKAVKTNAHGWLRKGITTKLALSLVPAVIGILAGAVLVITGETTIGILLMLASLLYPLNWGTDGYLSWLTIEKRFKELGLSTVIYNLVYAFGVCSAVGIAYVYRLELLPTLVLILVAYFASKGIVRLIYFRRALVALPKLPRNTEEGDVRKYGVHLSASQFLSPLAFNIDSLLVFSFLGPESLAIYSFALIGPDQIKALMKSVKSIMQPKIFSRTDSELKLLPKKLLRANLFVAIAVLAYIGLAPFLYQWFFPRYTESVLFSQVIALSVLLLPFSLTLDSAIEAMGRIRRVYAFRISPQIVKIVLVVALIPPFGIWGAVLALILSRAYTSLFMVYLTKR